MATFPKGHSAFLMRCENAAKIARALRETGGNLELARPTRHTAADAITLRGIPCSAKGVAGVVLGTQPEAYVVRWFCDD